VVFEGFGSSGQRGIYTFIAGTLGVVADLSTAIPGGSGTFDFLGSPVSLGGGDVIFSSLAGADELGGRYL